MTGVPVKSSERHDLPGLEIREALAADAIAVARLRSDRSGRPYGELLRETESEISSLDPKRLMLHVATMDGDVAGFGRCKYVDPADGDVAENVPAGWYLLGIIVAAAHRGRGVGTGITEFRLNWIAERARRVYYFADSDNLASIRLHDRFGFVAARPNFEFRKDEPSPTPMTLFVRELTGASATHRVV
jgi:RimJ/RimL family protein N-acetyltransferase